MGAECEAQGVAERRTRGGEMLPMLVVGWRVSELRDEEAGRFREVAGVSIVAAGGLRSRRRHPSGLNKLSIDQDTFSGSVDAGFVLARSFHHGDLESDCVEVSTRGRGLMRGIKILPQDFPLKMQGGAYARGGVYLRDTTVYKNMIISHYYKKYVHPHRVMYTQTSFIIYT